MTISKKNFIFPIPCILGMLHVPIDNLLRAPDAWQNYLELPSIPAQEYQLIQKINQQFRQWDTIPFESFQDTLLYQYCEKRMLEEAKLLFKYGFHGAVLENIGPPYHIGDQIPPLIIAIMNQLSGQLRQQYPDKIIGLQILAQGASYALSIACRHQLDFIRVEGTLFSGLRPEGILEAGGLLAKLYEERSYFYANLNNATRLPFIFVDVAKKHTLWPLELSEEIVWQKASTFMKLEGIILTGKETGEAPIQEDVESWFRFLENTYTSRHQLPRPYLIIGSGVNHETIKRLLPHSDIFIIGSALKREGYWEAPLDESNIQKFVDSLS